MLKLLQTFNGLTRDQAAEWLPTLTRGELRRICHSRGLPISVDNRMLRKDEMINRILTRLEFPTAR